jgi:hypothetical protein
LHNSDIARRLLRTLIKNGVIAQNAAKLTAGKTFTMFPQLPKADLDFHAWKPACEDLFAKFENYPPTYVTDSGFSGAEVLREVKAVIDQIAQVPPLTQWYQQMIKAHEQDRLPLSAAVPSVELTLNSQFFSAVQAHRRILNAV